MIGELTNSNPIIPAPPWSTISNRFRLDSNDSDEDDEFSSDVSLVRIGNIETKKDQNATVRKGTIILLGILLGHQCRFLVDCGATGEFVSSQFVKKHQMSKKAVVMIHPQRIEFADGTEYTSLKALIGADWNAGGFSGKRSWTIAPLVTTEYDAILGMNWLEEENPIINWKKHQIHARGISESANKPSTPADSITPINDIHANISTISSNSNQNNHNSSINHISIPIHPQMVNLINKYQDVFPAKLPQTLPPKREMDHRILLKPGTEPIFRKQYRLSPADAAELDKQCEEHLAAGWISSSTSPFNAPSIFVGKKDGGRRWCNDNRALNEATIKDKTPLPLIEDMLARLQGPPKLYSKLDLKKGFYQIQIHPDDRYKTAFSTPKGHFQWNVMCMGLTNAPATFQALMQKVLKERLYQSVMVFVDDILIYSHSIEEHIEHVEWVLSKLREHQLYAALEKCEFGRTEISFLGHTLSAKGISVMKEKIEAIQNWPDLCNAKETRSFLGLTGYHRKWVKDYGRIAAPLTELTKPSKSFIWGENEKSAFIQLKKAITNAPVLVPADPQKPFRVTTDASGFAVGAILSQADANGAQQPLAYYSHKMSSTERNYPVHEQELLAVFLAFKHWRCYLHGCIHPVNIITDHESLKYINIQPHLSARQARIIEFLQDFDLVISYRPGSENAGADALSRRPDWEREAAAEDKHQRLNHDNQQKPRLHYTLAAITQLIESELITEIKEATQKEELGKLMLAHPDQYDMSIINGSLCNPQGCIYIPNDRSLKVKILHEVHDAPTGGHLGIEKTISRLGRLCWWPGMRKEIQDYIYSCVACQSNKSSNRSPAGKLQSLPIPTKKWEQVSMDFVGPLPLTKADNDFIMVVVDKLSKMVHFIPCKTTVTAPQVAKLFFREIVRHHGIPTSIVSDRDTRFTSHFWEELWRLFGTRLAMSTSRHPQTDGQTERVNRVLEEILRSFVQNVGEDWDQYLTAAEIAINSSKQASTGYSPYYLNNGEEFYLPIDQALQVISNNPTVNQSIQKMNEHLAIAKLNIEKAQQRQAKYADEKRREGEEYKIGDRVMLSTEGLVSKSGKLMSKFIGPFSVISIPSRVNVKLDLPRDLQLLFNTFHISRVKPFRTAENEFPERKQLDRPLPELVEGHKEYEVEQLIDKRVVEIGKTRRKKKVIQYLVKWEGYPMSETTWQNEEILRDHAAEMIEEYENKHQRDQEIAAIQLSKDDDESSNQWSKANCSLLYS